MRAPRRVDDERGAVLVEFGLIMPLLATLLFGMLSGGLVLDRRITITQAAREGARYGATVALDQCMPTTNCAGRTWAQQVQSVAASRAGGKAQTADVCVALVEGPGSAPVAVSPVHTTKAGSAPCYVDHSADIAKRVQVVITVSDRIDAVLVRVPLGMTARATARLEE